jgi:hypothetical protein
MRRLRVVAAAFAASLLLAGCVGGSSSTPSAIPVATGGSGTPVTASASGRGTLTIKFPVNYVTAKKASSMKRRGAASAVRHPAYVNPGIGGENPPPVLDIYVNQNLQSNLDGEAGYDDSVYINNENDDGTQAISLPLYSSQSNDIVVVEWDSSSHDSVLAIAETVAPAFTAGTAPVITAELQMNVQNVVISASPSNAGTTIPLDGSNPTFSIGTCNAPYAEAAQDNAFYLFAADALGGYVATPGSGASSTSGYGGTVLPSISQFTSSEGGTTTVASATSSGSASPFHYVVYDSAGDSVQIEVTVPDNPAASLLGLAASAPSAFPTLGNTVGYIYDTIAPYINDAQTSVLTGAAKTSAGYYPATEILQCQIQEP